MEHNLSKRGGSRPGAGRKRLSETEKKVTLGLTVSRDLKDRLFRVAQERGISASELVAELLGTI